MERVKVKEEEKRRSRSQFFVVVPKERRGESKDNDSVIPEITKEDIIVSIDSQTSWSIEKTLFERRRAQRLDMISKLIKDLNSFISRVRNDDVVVVIDGDFTGSFELSFL